MAADKGRRQRMPVQNIQIWPDWKIVRELGRGSFGEVYEIHRQNGSYLEKAALKVIRIPSNPSELLQLRADGLRVENTEQYYSRQVEDIRNEIGIMSKFVGYSNIVSYEDYMIRKHDTGIGWDILIRMELLTALSDYLVTHVMQEEQILQLGLDISQALIICHKAGIVHRDIKPQNIFINDMGVFKLGDFGISRPLPRGSDVMSFKGSIAYMAPESFAMRNTDARSDIYSLALVLYRCLNGGREPFLHSGNFGPAEQEMAQRRRLAGEPVPRPERGSHAFWQVLSAALSANPSARYQSARQFHNALLKVAGGPAGERRLRRISPTAHAASDGTLYLNQHGNMQGSAGSVYPDTVQNGNMQKNVGNGYMSGARQAAAGNGYRSVSGQTDAVHRYQSASRQAGAGKETVPAPAPQRTTPVRPVFPGRSSMLGKSREGTVNGRPAPAGRHGAGTQTGEERKKPGRGLTAPAAVKARKSGGRTLLLALCVAAAFVLGSTGVWMLTHPSGGYSGTSTGGSGGTLVTDDSNAETQTISSMKGAAVEQQSGNGSGTAGAGNDGPLTGEGMEETVVFKDPVLKDAVCSYLGIHDREVTRGDVLRVTTLELAGESRESSGKITNLTGIAAFENLEVLDLKENSISDITELGMLTKLERLDLANNRVVDVTPLENLDSLEWLDLMNNDVSDISPITSLSHVYMLDISGNQVADISGINGMTDLMGVLMDDNSISDIRPLAGLQNLIYLTFGDNNVRDISVLSELPDLEVVFLYENEVKDIRVLTKLKNLTDLAVFGNPIEDEKPLEELGDSVTIHEPD